MCVDKLSRLYLHIDAFISIYANVMLTIKEKET